MRTPDLNPHLSDREKALLEAGEFLWAVVANASGGDWSKQSKEWQEAAARGRDDFHAVATSLNAKVA